MNTLAFNDDNYNDTSRLSKFKETINIPLKSYI
jgi:hypothetical protein